MALISDATERQGKSTPVRAGYGWTSVRHDAIAGLTVAAIATPQAMAYALIAGVKPVYGLYAAIVVTAVGSIFGSSSFLINGPTNAISLVVFTPWPLLPLLRTLIRNSMWSPRRCFCWRSWSA